MISAQTGLNELPDTSGEHYRLYLRAAIYHLVWHCNALAEASRGNLEGTLQRFPFLKDYFNDVAGPMPMDISWDDGLHWWRDQILAWEQGSNIRLPLLCFDDSHGIDYLQRLALVVIGLPDADSRFGSAFAWLQSPLDARRPSIELTGRIVGVEDPWALCRPLLDARLVSHAGDDGPRPEWVLNIPTALWDVIRGEPAATRAGSWRLHSRDTFQLPQDLIFPTLFRDQVEGAAQLVTDREVRVVVARGSEGCERLDTLGAIAKRLEMDVLETLEMTSASDAVDSLLGPYATLADALPICTFDLGPGESARMPTLAGYNGPIGVVLGRAGGLHRESLEHSLTLDLPQLGPEDRMRRWSAALGASGAGNLEEIARRYVLPGGHIQTVATIAKARAALREDQTLDLDDVRVACRALNRQQLDSLADLLEPDGSWSRLITSKPTSDRLRELEQRCMCREALLDHLGPGFGTSTTAGVRALFTGPSGTGKTLAARTLAAELGMDLYRVDLASVINKYIGETEKNLHTVLSRAEELDVVLLLDEGDALLGSRTEVRSSNDRYANLETNYLLQRLEHYRGIVVVTTNASQNIDTAFQRRMDIVVPFTLPLSAERRRIWELHLPDRHVVKKSTLDRIALRCAFTGGQIRNAAMQAILLAMNAGDELVGDEHLIAAIQSEYRKSGASIRFNERPAQSTRASSVATFVGVAPRSREGEGDGPGAS